MPQAYISDLDHTLLRSDLSLSSFSVGVWNALSRHATLSVATARSYKKALQFLGSLHLNAPLVLLDGALVVTPQKQIIDLKILDRETGDAIIAEGSKFGIFPVIITLEDAQLNEAMLYPAVRNPHQDQLIGRYRGDDHLVEQRISRAREQNFKIVYMGEQELLHSMHEHFKALFGSNVKMIYGPEAYLGCHYLTLLHPLADKAHGLVTAAHHTNHEASEMTVFGDSTNDLGMFKLAQTAIAVQNAIEEVKKAADIVLPHTNDEDAVAHYLKRFC